MSFIKTFTASLVVMGGMTLVAPAAYAQDAVLLSPAGGLLEQSGVISLQVPDSVTQERFVNFFLQLDGDDITGLVSVDGRHVTYQSPVRLALGNHTLILTEKIGETQLKELARWTIRVGGGGWKDAAVTGDIAGQYNYLLSDNLEGEDKVKPHSGTATVNAAANMATGDWENAAKFSGFFDSKSENNIPDEDHFILGEYLFTTRHNGDGVTTTVNLGNHDAGISNMLVDQYYRRGLSARFDIDNWLRVTTFAQDPARAIGNGNISGLAREDQRAQGAFVKAFAKPDAYGERLSAEVGYYDGKGSIAGDGAGIPTNTNNEGSGWAAALEGQTLDDKINARADVAQTKFDDDGAGVLVRPKRDEAYRARLTWSPVATLSKTDTSPEKWQLGSQYQRIGTYYRSLANLSVPVDEQRMSLTSAYLNNSLTLTGETYAVENNVSRDVSLPTDRGVGALAQASVQPVFFNDAIAPESFLGHSVMTAGATWSREQRHETPVGFLGDGLDQQTISLNAGWTVAYERATASLSHSYSIFDNDALPQDSYHTNFTEMSVTWIVSDRFTVTPALQMQIQRDAGIAGAPPAATKQYFVSIDTSAILIPDKLTHTFHYGALLDNGTVADDQHNASTEFVWQLKQAAVNDPGYALGLSANYEHATRDPLLTASTKDENYKVFLSFKVSSPFAF